MPGSYGGYGAGSYGSAGAAPVHHDTVGEAIYHGAAVTADPVADDKALFVLRVPDDAVVYFAGRKMNNDGSRRTFVSPELKAGKVYSYDIKVEVDGEEVAGRQKIRRGDRIELVVDMDDDKLTMEQAAGQDLLELKIAESEEADDSLASL